MCKNNLITTYNYRCWLSRNIRLKAFIKLVNDTLHDAELSIGPEDYRWLVNLCICRPNNVEDKSEAHDIIDRLLSYMEELLKKAVNCREEVKIKEVYDCETS